MDIPPQAIHYAAGVVPAMFYGVRLDPFDRIGFARGLAGHLVLGALTCGVFKLLSR